MYITGVPQGSCLGPVLFLLYVSGISEIISEHLRCYHAFADDTQLYLSFKPQKSLYQESAVKAMEDCIDNLRNWMIVHRLFIQSAKTEFIIIGSILFKKFVEHHVIKLILLKISKLSAHLTQAIIRDKLQRLNTRKIYVHVN